MDSAFADAVVATLAGREHVHAFFQSGHLEQALDRVLRIGAVADERVAQDAHAVRKRIHLRIGCRDEERRLRHQDARALVVANQVAFDRRRIRAEHQDAQPGGSRRR